MTENTPTPAELSAEARSMMQRQEWMPAELAIRMADALEAVTAERDEAVRAGERITADALNVSAERDALAATIAQARGLLRDNDFEWAKQVDAILSKLPADALAAHDARMKATALREFADAVRMPWQVFQGDAGQVIRVGDLLRETADRIEREAQR